MKGQRPKTETPNQTLTALANMILKQHARQTLLGVGSALGFGRLLEGEDLKMIQQ